MTSIYLPNQLNDYTVLGLLSEEGLSHRYGVCKKSDLEAQQIYELQVLPNNVFGNKVNKVKEEWNFIQRNNEKNVMIKVIDVARDSINTYRIQELHQGLTLAKYLDIHGDNRRLPWSQTMQIFSQLCEGILALHKENLVHQSLSSHKILIYSEYGQIKVKFQDGFLLEQCDTLYSAPEQDEQNGANNKITNVYNLGMILFEMLTGQLPWAKEDAQLFRKKRRNHFSKWSDAWKETLDSPKLLQVFMDGVIQGDENKRIPTVEQLFEGIRDIVEGNAVIPLRDFLRDKHGNQRIEWREALDLFTTVATSLDRHLKSNPPLQILCPETIEIRPKDKTISFLQTEERPIGCESYMTATQLNGNQATVEDNIFSLAAIFYEMLVAELPWSKIPDEQLEQKTSKNFQLHLELIKGETPQHFERVLQRALRLGEESFYRSGKALLRDISTTPPPKGFVSLDTLIEDRGKIPMSEFWHVLRFLIEKEQSFQPQSPFLRAFCPENILLQMREDTPIPANVALTLLQKETNSSSRDYLPPEVLSRGRFDPAKVQVYQLGAILLKVMVGYLPWPPAKANPKQNLLRRQKVKLTTNQALNSFPKWLLQTIEIAIHPNPGARWINVRHFFSHLRRQGKLPDNREADGWTDVKGQFPRPKPPPPPTRKEILMGQVKRFKYVIGLLCVSVLGVFLYPVFFPTSMSIPSECSDKEDEGEIMDCSRKVALKNLEDESRPLFYCQRIKKSNMFDASIGSQQSTSEIIEACMTYASTERNVKVWFELLADYEASMNQSGVDVDYQILLQNTFKNEDGKSSCKELDGHELKSCAKERDYCAWLHSALNGDCYQALPEDCGNDKMKFKDTTKKLEAMGKSVCSE